MEGIFNDVEKIFREYHEHKYSFLTQAPNPYVVLEHALNFCLVASNTRLAALLESDGDPRDEEYLEESTIWLTHLHSQLVAYITKNHLSIKTLLKIGGIYIYVPQMQPIVDDQHQPLTNMLGFLAPFTPDEWTHHVTFMCAGIPFIYFGCTAISKDNLQILLSRRADYDGILKQCKIPNHSDVRLQMDFVADRLPDAPLDTECKQQDYVEMFGEVHKLLMFSLCDIKSEHCIFAYAFNIMLVILRLEDDVIFQIYDSDREGVVFEALHNWMKQYTSITTHNRIYAADGRVQFYSLQPLSQPSVQSPGANIQVFVKFYLETPQEKQILRCYSKAEPTFEALEWFVQHLQSYCSVAHLIGANGTMKMSVTIGACH